MYSFLIIEAHEDVTPFFMYAETNKEEKNYLMYFTFQIVQIQPGEVWSLV